MSNWRNDGARAERLRIRKAQANFVAMLMAHHDGASCCRPAVVEIDKATRAPRERGAK